jgi:hypothetical protein
MKGIIIDYNEEKGFGFLKDENMDNRFFHISEIIEQVKFLSNIPDFYYSDWDDRKCFVVNFIPNENERGLNALRINLTNQVFNDMSSKIEFEAKIIDLKNEKTTFKRIASGIQKGMPAPFTATTGGNGTYRIGYPEVIHELNIYFHRTDDIGWGKLDVKDLVLMFNNRSKITEKLVETLKNQILQKTIKIKSINKEWNLIGSSILVVK